MRIEGFVEFESENQIRGWAANAEQLDQVLQVEVICRGETVATGVATEFRDDLANHLGSGLHGFTFTLSRHLTAEEFLDISCVVIDDSGAKLPLRRTESAELQLRAATEHLRLERKIAFVHIPKTAGTAFRNAMRKFIPEIRRNYIYNLNALTSADFDAAKYDLVAGHFGTSRIPSDRFERITILRDPVDRLVSTYFFWKKLYNDGDTNTRECKLASDYSLEDFFQLKEEKFLIEELYNRVTWQLAGDFETKGRMLARDSGVTDDRAIELALSNLKDFVLVGNQNNIGSFESKFHALYGIPLKLRTENATPIRLGLAELPRSTRKSIESWVELDIELMRRWEVISNSDQ